MAKSPTERNKSYRARLKVKTGLLSDIDRARREDLTEQFERTAGDPELIAKVREFFLRHPMCFTAPQVVNAIRGGAVMFFARLDRDHEPAAAIEALPDKQVTVHVIRTPDVIRMPDAIAKLYPIRTATRTKIRDKRDELIAAGLWGDDPL